MVNQGARQRELNEDSLDDLFNDSETISLSPIQSLPLEKPTSSRQERHRIQEITHLDEDVPVVSSLPTGTFMCRDDARFGDYESDKEEKDRIFREDLDSYTSFDSSRSFEPADIPLTPFERLYEPREACYWDAQVFADFESESRELERFMDQHDLARASNASRRITKAENVKAVLPRFSAAEIKNRMENRDIKDLFGYFAMLPHPFSKSIKSRDERKIDLMGKYSEYFNYFNYANRPGSHAMAKHMAIQNKLVELQAFLDDPEGRPPPAPEINVPVRRIGPSKRPKPVILIDESSQRRRVVIPDDDLVISVNIQEQQPCTSEAIFEKRVVADEGDVRIPKKVRKEQRSSDDQPPGVTRKVVRNIDPSCEREILLRQQRKEAAMKREAEHFENQKRVNEEHERQAAAERAEYQRRREEKDRMRAERIREQEQHEEELRQERIKKAEAHKKATEAAEAMRKKREEEKKQREVDEEFEKLKQRLDIEAREQEDRMAAEKKLPVPEPIDTTSFQCLRVKMPNDWSKRKDAYYNRYEWPSDAGQREIERMSIPRGTDQGFIDIPWQDYPGTRLIPLFIPPSYARRSASSSNLSSARSPALPVTPVYIPGDTQLLDKLVSEIKELMGPARKNIANHISLTAEEVDYQKIPLHKLRSCFVYPFFLSEGLYWPLFFMLDDTSTATHVEALTVCNTFSGRHASKYLLTTTAQEDSAAKKFDSTYHDCAGPWHEYSQKPGRFSQRIGYKAHLRSSTLSFEEERDRARKKLKNDFANERREEDELEHMMDDFRRRKDDNRNELRKHFTLHLRQLVKDARLDVFSLKETFSDYDRNVVNHPGTRTTPIEYWWHIHGYRLFLKTRDEEYGTFMHRACADYEKLLERKGSTGATAYKFSEWAFTPMLASLHYQSKYAPYDVFSSKDMKVLADRYKQYNGMLKEKKFHFDKLFEICKLTDLDKKQWTILNDQLVSHFRQFPAIFTLIFNTNGALIHRVDYVVDNIMNTDFKDRNNMWNVARNARHE
ncbi:hypothetical protein L5515_003617 [Caenorhabditis briggsae]|uniref:Uncharacterized protein n=1 Tax=Caenorhabditis briggsae TaxID=6238 RepID=A0AAE9JC77_CAEBR|nr:hypothetical protein L5515_003617 [Caenorhabditis briggsae]